MATGKMMKFKNTLQQLLIILVISILSSSSILASSQCMNHISSSATLKWSKSCKSIISDSSQNEVESINLCIGEFTKKNKTFFVINGHLFKKDGFVKKDSIIVTASYGNGASISNDTVMLNKTVMSPELLKRTQYTANYDQVVQTLDIEVKKGLFSLTSFYKLHLQCR